MGVSGFDLKTVLAVLALTYVSVLVVAIVFQRHMTYFPGKDSFAPAEWSMNGFDTLSLTSDGGLVFKSWYHKPLAPGKDTVVFFQGNGGHLGYRNTKVMPWVEDGYGLLLVGYPGYNGNPGKPSEEGLYRNARASIKALLNKGTPESRLVLYGESIGTGVAVQMASEFHAAGLVLEAPFTSLVDAAAYHYPYLPVRLLMRERFDSLSKIGRINRIPLLWIHGEKDNIVPIALGRRLFDMAEGPKKAAIIAGAGHNDLYDQDLDNYSAQGEVMKFLADLP